MAPKRGIEYVWGMFSRFPNPLRLTLILALCFLVSCGDEPLPTYPLPPSTVAVFEIQLWDALGIAPLDSVQLALLELESMRFVAPRRTGLSGFTRFDELVAGDYLPVIQGGDAILLPLPQTSWSLEVGDTLRVELRAVRLDPDQAQLSGRVVDADTGLPVGGATVEIFSNVLLPELSGYTNAHRQITDAQGRFALRDFLIIQLPDSGGTLVPDLICHAPGYRGLRRSVSFEELPALGVQLALQVGSDRASLDGRVVDLDGAPLAGVPLAIEWVSQPSVSSKGNEAPDPSALILQTFRAESGSDGSYHFEDLPAGFFRIAPGYRLDDGWLRVDGRDLPPGFERPQIQIAEGEQAQLGDIAAAPAILALAPGPGEIVGPQPDFAWEAWSFMGTDWATAYRLVVAPFQTLDPNHWLILEPIVGEELSWPDPESFLPPGRHAWRVDAIGGSAQNFILFESWARFEVRSPQTDFSNQNPVDSRIIRSQTDLRVTRPAPGASQPPDGR